MTMKLGMHNIQSKGMKTYGSKKFSGPFNDPHPLFTPPEINFFVFEAMIMKFGRHNIHSKGMKTHGSKKILG